jgi:hypothetical protein
MRYKVKQQKTLTRKEKETLEMQAIRSHLIENALIVAASIFLAILLIKSAFFHELIQQSLEARLFGSFIVGLFFTSLFTAAPATVAFFEIAKENSILFVALLGALGAVLGDLLIFKFIRSHLTDELIALFSRPKKSRWQKLFHLKAMQWLFTFIGIIAIASPLPDEIGLLLMGVSKLRARYLIPISFGLNFAGILAIGLVAKQFM